MVYSKQVLDRFWNPRRQGPLEGRTHTGLAGEPGEGPFIRIDLLIEGSEIKDAAYESNGCPASIACASLACDLVIGKPIEFIAKLEAKDLDILLGGLPEGKKDKASLAVGALSKAVENSC